MNSFPAAENLEKLLVVGLQHEFEIENHIVDTGDCKHQRDRSLFNLAIFFFAVVSDLEA